MEPSDIERGELPETIAAYMADLETKNEALRESVLQGRLENKRLRSVLHHIGYETLTYDMEASWKDCLDEATRLARNALLDKSDANSRVAQSNRDQADAQKKAGDAVCTIGTGMIDSIRDFIKKVEDNRPYGCHCDLCDGDEPDECVIDTGRPDDCVEAMWLVREGKTKLNCKYWKPIEN